MRFFGERLDLLEDRSRHAERFEPNGTSAAIEHAEDDAFAVQRRHRGYANVQLAVCEAHADAAILRAAPLRDVQLRHQLEAGENRGLESLGRGWSSKENPVEAKPDHQAVAHGFEMDVARPGPYGLTHEEVDVRCNWRRVRNVADIRDQGFIIGFGAPNGERVLSAGCESGDQSFDFFARRVLGDDRAAISESQVIECFRDSRVGRNRDNQGAMVGDGRRAYAMVEEVFARNAAD